MALGWRCVCSCFVTLSGIHEHNVQLVRCTQCMQQTVTQPCKAAVHILSAYSEIRFVHFEVFRVLYELSFTNVENTAQKEAHNKLGSEQFVEAPLHRSVCTIGAAPDTDGRSRRSCLCFKISFIQLQATFSRVQNFHVSRLDVKAPTGLLSLRLLLTAQH